MLRREDLGAGVTRLTLDNPDAANALTDSLLAELWSAVRSCHDDLGVRCLILRGEGGRVFSSGYHTTQLEPARFRDRPDPIGPICQALLESRVPTVACLNGHVIGGAVEIAASCDIRVGQAGASVRIPAARFGICYAPGGIARLCAALGTQLALELLLSGEAMAVEDCARAGFLSRVVAPEEIDDRCLTLARSIASAAPLAVEAGRRIVHDVASPGPRRDPASNASARGLFEACLASADLDEGLRALAERRPPVFRRA